MSQLSRIFQKFFGSSGPAGDFGQFGSRAAGAPVYSKDPTTIQALSAFLDGLKPALNAGNKALFTEDLNSVLYLLYYQICYGFQSGIAEWDGSTTYYTGSIVRKAGTTELYGSFVDNNTGNALPAQINNSNWQYLNPPAIPPGIILPAAGGVAPLGCVLSDGTPIQQAVYPSLYSYIGTTWNTFRGQAAPAAGYFRTPALQGLTLIGAGSGFGLTARALAQMIGAETHTLNTGEMPSHGHTDSGHAHPGPSGSAGSNIVVPYAPGFSLIGWTNGGSAYGAVSLAPLTGYSAANIQPTGGGGAHNNMQPSAVINWAIKY